MKKLLVINGPSINLLGYREREVYGDRTYGELLEFIDELAKTLDVKVRVVQDNSEGKIIDYLQDALLNKYDGIIINPGAYTHYSYAIHDAIKGVNIPTIEVHISDLDKREDFRKTSVILPACVKQIKGKGFDGYNEAIDLLL